MAHLGIQLHSTGSFPKLRRGPYAILTLGLPNLLSHAVSTLDTFSISAIAIVVVVVNAESENPSIHRWLGSLKILSRSLYVHDTTPSAHKVRG